MHLDRLTSFLPRHDIRWQNLYCKLSLSHLISLSIPLLVPNYRTASVTVYTVLWNTVKWKQPFLQTTGTWFCKSKTSKYLASTNVLWPSIHYIFVSCITGIYTLKRFVTKWKVKSYKLFELAWIKFGCLI